MDELGEKICCNRMYVEGRRFKRVKGSKQYFETVILS